MILKKIISGGQTGADQGGLMAAAALGIETGGWAPKDWMTEDGPAPWLEGLGLKEADLGYAIRTQYNVHDATATVIFGDVSERGSALTLKMCRVQGVPHIVNPTAENLRQFVEREEIDILNVAGNRESKSPGICQRVIDTITEAFQ